MKKFFSLVLALVMALSLTTVAWGADVTVTHTGDNAASGTALYNAVMAAADGDTINVGAGTYYLTNGQTSRFNLNNKSVTIVGAGEGMTILQGERYGVVLSDNVNPDSTTTFTLKNMTIESVGTGSAVYAKDDVTVNLVDVTLAVQGGTAILLDSCNEIAGAYHDGVETVVNVTNVTIPDGKKIEIAANPVSSIPNAGVVSYGSVNIGAGNNFTAADVQPQNISLGTNNIAVNGAYINADTTGASTSYNNVYLKSTAKGAVISSAPVSLAFFKAVDNKVDETTGAYKADGNVAYYTTTSADFTGKYAQVATVAEADVIVYADAAGTIVYMYLDAINPVYFGDGVAVTNFGTACGQYNSKDADYDKEATYYTAFNALYVEVETSAIQLMVNGKLVPVNGPVAIDKVAHKAVTTTDKKGAVESIKCAACGVAAVKAGNYASVPTGAVTVMQEGNAYWYWPVVGGVVSGDVVVESAETFDAGIAMYVGMSVMAAAGSAVVIGKKKD